MAKFNSNKTMICVYCCEDRDKKAMVLTGCCKSPICVTCVGDHRGTKLVCRTTPTCTDEKYVWLACCPHRAVPIQPMVNREGHVVCSVNMCHTK